MIKLLIGGSPCTHWSIAQSKNRETKAEGSGYLIELVSSIKDIKDIVKNKHSFIQKLIYSHNWPDKIMDYEYEVDPETVCQYTGRMDKNGKKIWENDFVRFASRFNKELIWQGKVVYENFQFVVYELYNGVYDGYSVIPLSRVSMCNLEVIGNIYDEED